MPTRHIEHLRKDDTALVMIDMQEPFLRDVHDRELVVKRVQILLDAAKVLGLPIIATLQNENRLGGYVPEIAERLPENFHPIDKMTFSCMGSEEFRMALRVASRHQILICGVETHICVSQTALDLLRAGYQAHVAADAVSSRSKEHSERSLDRMAKAGVVISNSESALYEMLVEAGTSEFKQILNLIK
jgi:nicotinamidase-related amidase